METKIVFETGNGITKYKHELNLEEAKELYLELKKIFDSQNTHQFPLAQNSPWKPIMYRSGDGGIGYRISYSS